MCCSAAHQVQVERVAVDSETADRESRETDLATRRRERRKRLERRRVVERERRNAIHAARRRLRDARPRPPHSADNVGGPTAFSAAPSGRCFVRSDVSSRHPYVSMSTTDVPLRKLSNNTWSK